MPKRRTTLFLLLLCGWCHRAYRVWSDPRGDLRSRQHGLLCLAFFTSWAINGMFHDTSLMMNANLLLCFVAGMSQGLYACLRETSHQFAFSSVRSRVGVPSAWRARTLESHVH